MFLQITATILFISCPLAQTAFTDSEIQALNDVFNFYDKNHDGLIDAEEVIKIYASMGMNFTDKQVENRIQEYSTNGNGQMSVSDFRNMMSYNVDTESKQKILKNMSGGQNYINIADLKTMLEKVDFKFNDNELQEIDTNGDLKITLEEIEQSNYTRVPTVTVMG